MNTDNETNDLFDQIDLEMGKQDSYGLQYIINDLFVSLDSPQKEDSTDWYGLNDLIIG